MAITRNQLLAAGTIALLGVAAYVAFDLNRSGQEEVVRQFNALQGLLARQSAHEVVMQLEEAARDAQALSRRPSFGRHDLDAMEAELQAHYKTTEHALPLSVSVVDERGMIVYSTWSSLAASNYAGCDFFEWARKRESRGRVFVSAWARQPRERVDPRAHDALMVAVPLYRTEAGANSGARTWSGALLVTVEVESVLLRHLSELSAQPRSHRVWIMDRDGTILLQSEHPEMIRENINQFKPACAQCHVSFDYAQQMLQTRTGVATYQLKGQPKKLAAFAPMRFANASWIVVVNAPYAEVTAFVQASYARMLWVLGMIAAAVALASLLMHRCNLSRARAEAEARQWQERLRLEADLRRAEERYRTLFEQSPDGIVVMDPESGRALEFNEAAHRQLGFTREEFAQLRLQDYEVMETPETAREHLQRLLRHGQGRYETRHRNRQGETRHVEVIAQTLELGTKQVLHCLYHDFTERRRAAEALEKKAEEVRREAAVKTTLLHDVNHRVKNNLMRLREIVRLERDQTPVADLRALLGDLESRLHGMSVVHNMLSGAQWQALPLNELAAQIVSAALSASPIHSRIRMAVSAPPEPLWVVPEQATAVALILNELATNSVKHAFRERGQGLVEVRLQVEDRANGRMRVRLDYRDNGPGWPESVLNGERQRVGLRLIQASVRSPLRGELSLRNADGAAAQLSFLLAAAQ